MANVLASLVYAVDFADDISSGLAALIPVQPGIAGYIESADAFITDPTTTAGSVAANKTVANATTVRRDPSDMLTYSKQIAIANRASRQGVQSSFR